jgi:branched-chain amino acid transport system permease protein
MITLALGQMLWGIAQRWRSVTGSDEGLAGIPRPDFGLPWSMGDATNFYFLILIFFLIAVFLLYRIVKSPFGNVLVGIRENEARMRALGYNTWMYKYCAYVLAAAFGGLAGVLFAFYNGFAATSELHWFTSGTVMIMAMVGGPYHFYGPIIGVFLVLGLKYVLGSYTEHWSLVMGAIFVFTVMYARQGLAGYVSSLMERWKIWKP